MKTYLAVLLLTLENLGYISKDFKDQTRTEKLSIYLAETLMNKAQYHPHLLIGFDADHALGVFNLKGEGMQADIWDSDSAVKLAKSHFRFEDIPDIVKLLEERQDPTGEQRIIEKIRKEIGL